LRKVRALFALLLTAVSAVPAPAQQRDWNDRLISRGVVADGRLWLRTQSGGLIGIEEARGRRFDADLGEEVRDICAQDGALLAVTGNLASGRWNLRRRARGIWRFVASVPSQSDIFTGMDCNAGRVTLLTNRRIIEIGPGGTRGVPLRSELTLHPARVVLLGTPDQLYAGANAGEWGGGLHRIERATGRVTSFGGHGPGGCDALHLLCRQIGAILPAPWRPDCVVVAVGVVHFFPSGHLVQLCGDEATLLYSSPVLISDEEDGPRYSTEAFFGLLPAADRVIATGTAGLYLVGGDGSVQKVPYPSFRRVRGVDLSFDLPGVALVVTQIDRQVSFSVGSPLLIAR